MQFIPINTVKMTTLKIKESIDAVSEHYKFMNINITILKGEIDLWKSKWISTKNEGIY